MKWQPIETAPMDGTQIDLWSYDKAHGRWARRPNCSWERMSSWNNEDDIYGWLGLHYLYSDYQEPTHWMLLPEPPK